MILFKKFWNKEVYIFLVTISFLFSCNNTNQYYYCDDIKCSSGTYVLRDCTEQYYQFVKDSSDHNTNLNEKIVADGANKIIDSITNTLNYFSKEEFELLNRAIVQIDESKKTNNEYCISYTFNFQNLSELQKFKEIYAMYRGVFFGFTKIILEKDEKKKKQFTDTLQNRKYLESIIKKGLDKMVNKRNKIHLIKGDRNRRLKDTIFIFFPKKIKDITSNSFKISESKKKVTIFKTSENKEEQEVIINF